MSSPPRTASPPPTSPPLSSAAPTAECLPVDPAHIHFVPNPAPPLPDLDPRLAHLDVHCRIDHPATRATLLRAARRLRQHHLVAMPTETVYGLAALATSDVAVSRIFAHKHRPADNPLIVHVSSLAMLHALLRPASLPDHVIHMMATCWPGPLTLILPASPALSRHTTCGLPTMAVRIPSHPVARALIELAGGPLAAPSANRSGWPSPTRATHVLDDLAAAAAAAPPTAPRGPTPSPPPLLVLDAGACAEGLESTVVQVDPPTLLRPGPYPLAQLRAVPGWSSLAAAPARAGAGVPVAPGMKYRHYAPRAPVHLLGPGVPLAAYVAHAAAARTPAPRVGVLLLAGAPPPGAGAGPPVVFDARARPAALLFHGLRELDAAHCDLIVAPSLPRAESAALMNRLRKAASVYVEKAAWEARVAAETHGRA